MAGIGTEFFTNKRTQYQELVQQAESASVKLNAANQALALLAKPTLTQADAEQLVALSQQV